MNLMARVRWGTVAILACAVFLYAGDKKDKSKPAGAQQIDSGTFGVFVRGQRVVTETFSVQQDNGISVVKSKSKEEQMRFMILRGVVAAKNHSCGSSG